MLISWRAVAAALAEKSGVRCSATTQDHKRHNGAAVPAPGFPSESSNETHCPAAASPPLPSACCACAAPAAKNSSASHSTGKWSLAHVPPPPQKHSSWPSAAPSASPGDRGPAGPEAGEAPGRGGRAPRLLLRSWLHQRSHRHVPTEESCRRAEGRERGPDYSVNLLRRALPTHRKGKRESGGGTPAGVRGGWASAAAHRHHPDGRHADSSSLRRGPAHVDMIDMPLVLRGQRGRRIARRGRALLSHLSLFAPTHAHRRSEHCLRRRRQGFADASSAHPERPVRVVEAHPVRRLRPHLLRDLLRLRRPEPVVPGGPVEPTRAHAAAAAARPGAALDGLRAAAKPWASRLTEIRPGRGCGRAGK